MSPTSTQLWGDQTCPNCKKEAVCFANLCRLCYRKSYYQKNKAKILKAQKRYHQEHREERLQYLRDYQKKIREKEKAERAQIETSKPVEIHIHVHLHIHKADE